MQRCLGRLTDAAVPGATLAKLATRGSGRKSATRAAASGAGAPAASGSAGEPATSSGARGTLLVSAPILISR